MRHPNPLYCTYCSRELKEYSITKEYDPSDGSPIFQLFRSCPKPGIFGWTHEEWTKNGELWYRRNPIEQAI